MGGSYIRSLIQAWAAAFLLLSRIPMPIRPEYTEDTNRRSTVFYPLVGLVIGLIIAALAYYMPMLLPNVVAAAIVLIAWVALTGALHLDGLLDSADGLLSHRPRERKLEIMKDSRVGAMGVIVCVGYFLLKYTLILSIVERPEVSLMLLWLVPVWSRFFMTVSIAWWPYARGDHGMGSLFRDVSRRHVWLAGVVAFASSGIGYGLAYKLPLLLGWDPMDLGLTDFALVVVGAFLAVMLCGSAMAAAISRQLGGQTGDTYGAINELLEIILLLGVVLLSGLMTV